MLPPKALGGASGGSGFRWRLVALVVLQSPPLSSPGFSLHYLLLSCLLEGRSLLNLGPIWVIQHDLISRSLITSAMSPFHIWYHLQFQGLVTRYLGAIISTTIALISYCSNPASSFYSHPCSNDIWYCWLLWEKLLLWPQDMGYCVLLVWYYFVSPSRMQTAE